MKIAVCFRGISRSLSHTITSIRDNVLAPSRTLGEVRIFTHLFDQKTIDNPRSGEKGQLDSSEHRLLESDWLALEPPGECLEKNHYDQLRTFGDPWNDDFASLRNLIHELHSLKQGWLAAQEWNADAYLFLRPDLLYHQSFQPVLESIAGQKKSGLCVPLWQGWGGCNDRFAVATTHEAACSYAERIDHAVSYCQQSTKPLHAEEFLLDCLARDRIPLWFTTIKGSRVRAHGALAKENYKLLRKSNLPAVWHAFKTGFARV
jgi:hypothetical protein